MQNFMYAQIFFLLCLPNENSQYTLQLNNIFVHQRRREILENKTNLITDDHISSLPCTINYF